MMPNSKRNTREKVTSMTIEEKTTAEIVKEIFDELGEYASDFAEGHMDGDQFLQEFYRLRARYTGEVGMLSD